MDEQKNGATTEGFDEPSGEPARNISEQEPETDSHSIAYSTREGERSRAEDMEESSMGQRFNIHSDNPGGKGKITLLSRSRHQRATDSDERISSMSDGVSLVIEKLEGNFQSGILELKSLLAQLLLDRQQLRAKVKSMEEQLNQVSAERDQYHNATTQLQEEVVSVREQCQDHMKNNNYLQKELDKMQSSYEKHLMMIAGRHRSQRVAQRALSTWKKKIRDKTIPLVQMTLLEEENKKLREELLLYQEAAKQAFLRSATALNSEALTLFQDAATRRLGSDGSFEDLEDIGTASFSSSTHHDEQHDGNGTRQDDDKENVNIPSQDNVLSNERDQQAQISGQMGSILAQGHQKKLAPSSNQSHENIQRPERVPAKSDAKKYWKVSDLAPGSLREESRACLQQLWNSRFSRGESQQMPAVRVKSAAKHPQHGSQTTSDICAGGPHVHICHCPDTAHGQYKCPYCGPIQNAHTNFTVPPKIPRRVSETTRGKTHELQNPQMDGSEGKRKIVFKPRAATVLIEKHVSK